MNIKLIFFSALIMLASTSAMSKSVQVGDLETVALEKDNSSNAAEGFRIVLTGFDESHGVKEADLADRASGKLKQALLKNGVEIVNIERGIRKKLNEEIKLIEANGSSNFSLPEAANLAVRGEISSANMSSRYEEERENWVKGKMLPNNLPAGCTYSANVQGTLVFYRVDPVEKYRTVAIDGSASESIPGKDCPAIKSDRARNLYLRAVDEAIDDGNAKIMNALARKGYVESAKKDKKGKKYYYRISIAPEDGAKPGVAVEFIKQERNSKGSFDDIPFADGVIACTNHPQAAYAMVKGKEKDDISNIKENTPVRLKYQDDGLLAPATDLLKKFKKCRP